MNRRIIFRIWYRFCSAKKGTHGYVNLKISMINSLGPGDPYMRKWTKSLFIHFLAFRLFYPKQLHQPMLTCGQWYLRNKIRNIYIKKSIRLKTSSANCHFFVQGSVKLTILFNLITPLSQCCSYEIYGFRNFWKRLWKVSPTYCSNSPQGSFTTGHIRAQHLGWLFAI